jgi:hypothetical protein
MVISTLPSKFLAMAEASPFLKPLTMLSKLWAEAAIVIKKQSIAVKARGLNV